MSILLIKTDTLLSNNKLQELHADFVKQVESGVVIIPAYLEAKLLNVPDDLEVIVESGSVVSDFMSKQMCNND